MKFECYLYEKDTIQNRYKVQILWEKIQLRYQLSIIYIKDRYDLEFGL